MKVILRKSDSTTNLLLFVYNNNRTHFNKDALKLSSLIEIMKTFGKNESAIRMSLSRAVKAGILINRSEGGEVTYALTPSGIDAIIIWNEGVRQFWKRYELRNKPWDGTWHFINIEFADEHKGNRVRVMDRLQQIGFGVLSTNTWIAPYEKYNEISRLMDDFHIKAGVVQLNGGITVREDMNVFLEKVFKTAELERPYKKFITTFSEKISEIKPLCQEEWFIKKGHALPILHSLGWQFFKISCDDAMLPKALYPEWIGDNAAQLMKESRYILQEPVIQYLSCFK